MGTLANRTPDYIIAVVLHAVLCDDVVKSADNNQGCHLKGTKRQRSDQMGQNIKN